MSRFLAITASSEFRRLVASALEPDHDLQVLDAAVADGTPANIPAWNLGGRTDVIVFGPDVEPQNAFALAADLDWLHPNIVVVLAALSSAELTLGAMRAGIRDLIAPDTAVGPLRQALERAALTASSRQQSAPEHGQPARGRVISVMSPKGGVGKTTVATNLAVGLAGLAPMGAVIVDLDLQFGDVASGLGLEAQHTINDAVTDAASNDAMVLKAFLARHESGAYALCAPHRPAEADLIKPAHVTTLINQLSLEFPYVVLDTAPGLGDVVLAVLELATDGIWVCGMDIPSIRGLNHGLEVLRQLDLMPPTNTIVLNFADRHSGLSVPDVEATIGLSVDILLPRSRTLPFSTNAGIPLLQDGRRDPAAKGLRKLVERLSHDSSSGNSNFHRRVEIS